MQLAFQTTTTETLVVNDDLGAPRNVTISPGYFRMFLAPRTGIVGTSLTAPTAFISYLVRQLNTGTAGWSCAVGADGFLSIGWAGTRNPGTITFPGTNVVRNLLGFNANISIAPTGTQKATYHPTHNVYMMSRANDTGWPRIPPAMAGARLPTGRVFGWKDRRKVWKRTFDSRFHAYDWATRIAGTINGVASPYTGDTSRQSTASNTPGIVPPYGMDDFFDSALGNRIGAMFGTFQTVAAGTATTCECVYVQPETLSAEAPQKLEQPNNSTWYEWPGITITRDGTAPTDTF